MLNIDQNRGQNFGLDLAAEASAAGCRIIIIPDHAVDRATIAAKGWLQLTKPFTTADIRAVITKAVGRHGGNAGVRGRADGFAEGVIAASNVGPLGKEPAG